MATLMDFIMAQRGDESDPRFAANQQAMELQNIAANAQRPGMMPPPAFAGGFSPTMQPMQRAPMMMAAPQMVTATPLFPSIPPSGIQPSAYSGYGGQDSPRERVAMGVATSMRAPLPPVSSSAPGAPMQLASAAPSVRESFMQRLLGGPVYQSNGMPLLAQPQGPTPSGATLPPAMQATTPQQINFGNPDNPADFVRADRALMGLPEDALRIAGLLG